MKNHNPAGGHTFAGRDGTRLLVRTPDGEMLRLRVAPELKAGDTLRLILDSAPQPGDLEALRHAVNELRAVLTQRHRKLTHRAAARA